jgi:hypothetical protein
MKKPVFYLFIGVGLFLLSTGISFAAFKFLGAAPGSAITPDTSTVTPTGSRKSKIDPNIPRTEVCPLNGVKYTKQEKDLWSPRRPLAVMIENHADSRPTSGLSSADIIYEAVAEGGITRFMGIFYCNVAENTVFAPVRSARIYFTKLVLEYDALYNHVGGAGNCDDPTVNEKAKALCFIRRNNIKDLDQFGRAGEFKTCHRLSNRLDHDVAYEHTMACYSDELYKVAVKWDWTNVDEDGVAWDKNFRLWKFKEDDKTPGTTNRIAFDFWKGKQDYSVVWNYDAASHSYLRENGGQKAIDLNTNEQLAAKNVIIQFVPETGPLDEHLHMYYEVTGVGKMLLFQDGKVISGTWSKPNLLTRTRFLDSKGTEVSLDAGQIWIELVPSGNLIEYNP